MRSHTLIFASSIIARPVFFFAFSGRGSLKHGVACTYNILFEEHLIVPEKKSSLTKKKTFSHLILDFSCGGTPAGVVLRAYVYRKSIVGAGAVRLVGNYLAENGGGEGTVSGRKSVTRVLWSRVVFTTCTFAYPMAWQ